MRTDAADRRAAWVCGQQRKSNVSRSVRTSLASDSGPDSPGAAAPMVPDDPRDAPDGVFLLIGNLQPGLGGGILAYTRTLRNCRPG